MTPEEKAALIASIKEAIGERLKLAGITDDDFLKKMAGRLAAIEQIAADPAGARGALAGLSARSLFDGEAFTSRLKMVQDGAPTTGKVHLPGLSLKGLKSIVNMPDGGSPASGWQTPAQRGPVVAPVVPRLTLLDVLPVINVSSNQYEYIRVAHTNNADVQAAEGDQKAQGTITSELVQTTISTVAEWFHASNQVLADNAQLATFLTNLLVYDVRQKAESMIVAGDPDGFDGLYDQAMSLATSAELAPDIISEGLTFMTTLGYAPGFVTMHPLDFHRLRTLKADGGSEEYLVGSWSSPAAPNAWNTPIITSAALTQGEALIVDPSKVAVLDRQEVRVAVSSEDRDNFIKNMVTLLAEARFGLAVFDNGGVGKVTLPVPSP